MDNTLFGENCHMAIGLSPVADAFATTAGTSDVVSMKDHRRVVFLMSIGVGTTGTQKLTVEACDNVTPSNTTAIQFWYRQNTTNDTQGTLTYASVAADGFTTTAGSAKLIMVEVRDEDLSVAGYKYVRLKVTEVVDDPCLGGIIILLLDPRYPQKAGLRTEIT